jgi:putative membrane protein
VRASAVAATAIGLVAGVAVLGYFNVGAVLAAMRPIGFPGFAAVVAAQLVLFIPLGLAWWLVSLDEVRHVAAYVWGRLSREAASDVLPFSQLGGVLVAARVAVLGGVSLARASGSCMVDITLEIVAQLVYTLLGVALLAGRLGSGSGASPLIAPILGGVAVAAGLIALVVLSQRRGLAVIERLVDRLAPAFSDRARALTGAVEQAWGQKPRLWEGLCLHMVGWFGSAAGTWLILRFIDRGMPFLSVVAIESLLFAIRNAAFFVPGGLGVQEGAYALLGPLFGLPAEAALALSLLKRARDIGIGVPVLLAWQVAESRRALGR